MTAPAACPRCQSRDVAVIGRDSDALICRECNGAWWISPANPSYLVQIEGGRTARGECPDCGRVLARTWTGNGTMIVHGPRRARCSGSGKQPRYPRRHQSA